MGEKKIAKTVSKPANLFEKQNLMLMLAGAAVIAIGMFLMGGGKSNNPAVFLENEVYSFRRITIAPVLIVLGLVIEIIAIFRKPKGSMENKQA